MIEKYVTLNRTLRSLHAIAREIIDAYLSEGDGWATNSLANLMLRSLSDLEQFWPSELDDSNIVEIRRLISEKEYDSYASIFDKLLPDLEGLIDDYFSSQPYSDLNYLILDLLHPRIITTSYPHFKRGHFREAVLNSVVAVFDFIRERTGIDKDGVDLVTKAFSLRNPRLLFTTLDNESRRNDQKGFIQILQGIYQGVRNPKAHTLALNPPQNVAAQYLVFSSLLCRRVEEAQLVENNSQEK